MLTGWSDFSSLYLTELEKTRIDGETSSPSKSGNDGGDDDDDGSFTLTRSSHNLGTATQPTTNEIVLHHVHVNAIADYYDIPQLKQLVKTKIQNVLKTSWSAEGFSNVVKEVYSSTDLALHDVMTLVTSKHIEELVELEDFTGLDVMSDFAFAVIRTMIGA